MSIRALDILDVLECPHRVYLNHNGDPNLKSPISHFMELLHENGVKHEEEIIETFECERLAVDDIPTLAQATLEMMRRGVGMIYQGVLIQGDMVGRPDLMVRADGTSKLGSYFYFPLEIKNASGYEDQQKQRRKNKYGLQLAYYARLLEAVQGILPPEGQVIDLNRDVVIFPIGEYLPELDTLLPFVRRLVEGMERDEPALISGCANCQWRSPCREWLQANQDITLIPGISRSHKSKLLSLGLRKATDPLSWNRTQVVQLRGIGDASAEKWERQAYVLESKEVRILKRPSLPRAELEIFFDVENDPTQDLVYLIGLGIIEQGGNFEYIHFWADNRTQEEVAWREFLSFVNRILPRHPVVYHYSAHEKTMVRHLAKRYSFTSAATLGNLESLMHDLYRIIVDAVVLPTHGYGLKEVSRYLGFRYTDPNAGGAESIYWFNKYQDDPVQNAAYRDRLLQYNREDCLAMVQALNFVRGL